MNPKKGTIKPLVKKIGLYAVFLLSLNFLLPNWTIAASLAEHTLELPSWEEIFRVLTLRDYNTRVVVIGTTLLGLAAGLVGTFLILRKRALLSDTLSHATLPGIALTFILVTYFGGQGKSLIALITGAAIFSVLGTACVILLQRYSRIKDDAALGIVLSVFFGHHNKIESNHRPSLGSGVTIVKTYERKFFKEHHTNNCSTQGSSSNQNCIKKQHRSSFTVDK